MHRILIAVSCLALASCATGYIQGQREFSTGMFWLSRGSPYARGPLFDAESNLASAMAYENLTMKEWVSASSMRARALIELGRHSDARDQVSIDIEGYDAACEYDGDPVALLLIRAHALDRERALVQLLLAERLANTRRTELHVAWEQAHLLSAMGTDKSKAEALKLCNRHAGELDFDDLKKSLGGP